MHQLVAVAAPSIFPTIESESVIIRGLTTNILLTYVISVTNTVLAERSDWVDGLAGLPSPTDLKYFCLERFYLQTELASCLLTLRGKATSGCPFYISFWCRIYFCCTISTYAVLYLRTCICTWTHILYKHIQIKTRSISSSYSHPYALICGLLCCLDPIHYYVFLE